MPESCRGHVPHVGTEFHVSFPDEKELETILRETLRHLNEELRIVVDLTRADLQVMIRSPRRKPQTSAADHHRSDDQRSAF